jgi:methionyl aminopeptidase
MIIRKSPDEINLMREGGRIVAETVEIIKKEIKPEVPTKHLDNVADDYIMSKHARPAFKGYHGFPASICVSIDEAVVHGIPGSRRLQPGEIVSIDVGVEYKGYYGDAAFTVPVGNVSAEAARLIEITQKALINGIANCCIGKRLYDISYAIQEVAEGAGFSVVREYVGHGIGRSMHEDPQIPNFGTPGRGPLLEEGMVFALEPMVNIGGHKVEVLSDDWTVVTADRSLSAHFEHTIAVTLNGPLILTSL